jgi:hypothetical protein
MNLDWSEVFNSNPSEYVFVITRKRFGVSEYTMVEFDNFDGTYSVDEAKEEMCFSLVGEWEILSHVENISDGNDFINTCIDVDEIIAWG